MHSENNENHRSRKQRPSILRNARFMPSPELESMLEAVFADATRPPSPSTSPSPAIAAASMLIDVIERSDGIMVVADVPGFRRDEISVEFECESRRLSIAASHVDDTSPNAETCCGSDAVPPAPRPLTVIRERTTTSVRRVLSMPARVAGDGISAELCDGVLTVILPYAALDSPRRIDVN